MKNNKKRVKETKEELEAFFAEIKKNMNKPPVPCKYDLSFLKGKQVIKNKIRILNKLKT